MAMVALIYAVGETRMGVSAIIIRKVTNMQNPYSMENDGACKAQQKTVVIKMVTEKWNRIILMIIDTTSYDFKLMT